MLFLPRFACLSSVLFSVCCVGFVVSRCVPREHPRTHFGSWTSRCLFHVFGGDFGTTAKSFTRNFMAPIHSLSCRRFRSFTEATLVMDQASILALVILSVFVMERVSFSSTLVFILSRDLFWSWGKLAPRTVHPSRMSLTAAISAFSSPVPRLVDHSIPSSFLSKMHCRSLNLFCNVIQVYVLRKLGLQVL